VWIENIIPIRPGLDFSLSRIAGEGWGEGQEHWSQLKPQVSVFSLLSLDGQWHEVKERARASTSPLCGYAQHERPFSARPERSEAKSKDAQNANFPPLPLMGEG
jgi:hypothetical protein